MYLVELDPRDGLVKMDKSGTGWLAIKEFREVYEKYDRKGFTVVALTKDYLTIFRYYPRHDERFKRAMDHIFESRKAMPWDDELVQAAMSKYHELQYNSDMEQEQIYAQIKDRYLQRLNEANQRGDDAEIMKLNKSLNQHENAVEAFMKRFKKQEIIAESSITEGGYVLTRIEQDIEVNKKKSRFNTMGQNMENPDELNINQKPKQNGKGRSKKSGGGRAKGNPDSTD